MSETPKIPSPLSAHGLSTPRLDAVFSPEAVVDAMLRFEGALALALADTGIAPEEDAAAVAGACEAPLADPEGILATTWTAGTPVIALVAAIRERLDDDGLHQWVHHGATSQDVIDTANMLCAREGLDALEAHLVEIAGHLKRLVEDHRDQPQMGRTFLQHARPTTFGLRAASWLDATLGHLTRVRETSAGLAAQLGGPVGNLADYGSKGTEVAAALASRLGLEAPARPWHTDRSRVRDLVSTVDGAVASAAKIAMDVALLAQTDTAEVTVRPGGSSSMSGKRNPIDAVRALAAADVCHGSAAMVTGARPAELDRALGSWHVEWVALPLVLQTASAALEATATLLGSLEVDAGAMARRVDGDEPEPGGIDPRLIDGVLETYDEVIDQ